MLTCVKDYTSPKLSQSAPASHWLLAPAAAPENEWNWNSCYITCTIPGSAVLHSIILYQNGHSGTEPPQIVSITRFPERSRFCCICACCQCNLRPFHSQIILSMITSGSIHAAHTAETEIMSGDANQPWRKVIFTADGGLCFLRHEGDYCALRCNSYNHFPWAKSSVCAGIWRNAGGRFGWPGMSLASVASQDHGHSQAGVAGWPGGRVLRWLYSTCVHIFLFFGQTGGKQVGTLKLTARILGCSVTCTLGNAYLPM